MQTSEQAGTTKNIYQRLQAVMQEVAYVQKDATVSGGGNYKAVTHDMVTAVVRPHFVKHGIVVVPRLMEGAVVPTGRQTSSGNPILRYEGRYEVSFVNVDDPTDVCVIPASAHAEDQGDKAPGKALSYVTKGAILKVLMLESGDQDEGRFAPEPELTDAQKQVHEALKTAAMEGTAALEAKWGAIGKENRFALARYLDDLKIAAQGKKAA